jgi:hypothetical protein
MRIIHLLKNPPDWLAIILSFAFGVIGVAALFYLVRLKNLLL